MEKKKPPYAKAYIEITNLCNMHCSFCHGHSRISLLALQGISLRVAEYNLKHPDRAIACRGVRFIPIIQTQSRSRSAYKGCRRP